MECISLKDWFYTSPLNSLKMVHTTLRMRHFEEYVETTLQNGAFCLQTDQSGQPVLANGKHPKVAFLMGEGGGGSLLVQIYF